MKKGIKYIKYVPIELLIPHEATERTTVQYWNTMYKNKSFIPAVAVSDQNMIIDGHHRLEMCQQNGIKIINVCQIDYLDSNLILKGNFIKNDILKYVKDGKLFNSKTTQHYFKEEGILKELFEYQKKYSLL